MPVYCLSVQLEALRAIPDECRICVLLELEGGYFGLLCNEVTAIQHSQLRLHAVPACMHFPHTPIRALAVHEDQLLCVTTSTDLVNFIARQRYLPAAKLKVRQVAS